MDENVVNSDDLIADIFKTDEELFLNTAEIETPKWNELQVQEMINKEFNQYKAAGIDNLTKNI